MFVSSLLHGAGAMNFPAFENKKKGLWHAHDMTISILNKMVHTRENLVQEQTNQNARIYLKATFRENKNCYFSYFPPEVYTTNFNATNIFDRVDGRANICLQFND